MASKHDVEAKGVEPSTSDEDVNLKQGLRGDLDADDEFTYEEQRKIVHRIDRRLLVIIGLMYCVSLIDRGNLPNAAIAGMHDELGTNIGYRYVSFCSMLVPRNTVLTFVVYRDIGLLHYLYHLPATRDSRHPQDRPQTVSSNTLYCVGGCHGMPSLATLMYVN